jgi:hypothetical protein
MFCYIFLYCAAYLPPSIAAHRQAAMPAVSVRRRRLPSVTLQNPCSWAKEISAGLKWNPLSYQHKLRKSVIACNSGTNAVNTNYLLLTIISATISLSMLVRRM